MPFSRNSQVNKPTLLDENWQQEQKFWLEFCNSMSFIERRRCSSVTSSAIINTCNTSDWWKSRNDFTESISATSEISRFEDGKTSLHNMPKYTQIDNTARVPAAYPIYFRESKSETYAIEDDDKLYTRMPIGVPKRIDYSNQSDKSSVHLMNFGREPSSSEPSLHSIISIPKIKPRDIIRTKLFTSRWKNGKVNYGKIRTNENHESVCLQSMGYMSHNFNRPLPVSAYESKTRNASSDSSTFIYPVYRPHVPRTHSEPDSSEPTITDDIVKRDLMKQINKSKQSRGSDKSSSATGMLGIASYSSRVPPHDLLIHDTINSHRIIHGSELASSDHVVPTENSKWNHDPSTGNGFPATQHPGSISFSFQSYQHAPHSLDYDPRAQNLSTDNSTIIVPMVYQPRLTDSNTDPISNERQNLDEITIQQPHATMGSMNQVHNSQQLVDLDKHSLRKTDFTVLSQSEPTFAPSQDAFQMQQGQPLDLIATRSHPTSFNHGNTRVDTIAENQAHTIQITHTITLNCVKASGSNLGTLTCGCPGCYQQSTKALCRQSKTKKNDDQLSPSSATINHSVSKCNCSQYVSESISSRKRKRKRCFSRRKTSKRNTIKIDQGVGCSSKDCHCYRNYSPEHNATCFGKSESDKNKRDQKCCKSVIEKSKKCASSICCPSPVAQEKANDNVTCCGTTLKEVDDKSLAATRSSEVKTRTSQSNIERTSIKSPKPSIHLSNDACNCPPACVDDGQLKIEESEASCFPCFRKKKKQKYTCQASCNGPCVQNEKLWSTEDKSQFSCCEKLTDYRPLISNGPFKENPSSYRKSGVSITNPKEDDEKSLILACSADARSRTSQSNRSFHFDEQIERSSIKSHKLSTQLDYPNNQCTLSPPICEDVVQPTSPESKKSFCSCFRRKKQKNTCPAPCNEPCATPPLVCVVRSPTEQRASQSVSQHTALVSMDPNLQTSRMQQDHSIILDCRQLLCQCNCPGRAMPLRNSVYTQYSRRDNFMESPSVRRSLGSPQSSRGTPASFAENEHRGMMGSGHVRTSMQDHLQSHPTMINASEFQNYWTGPPYNNCCLCRKILPCCCQCTCRGKPKSYR